MMSWANWCKTAGAIAQGYTFNNNASTERLTPLGKPVLQASGPSSFPPAEYQKGKYCWPFRRSP